MKKLIVISGPSGVGKGTVIAKLMEKDLAVFSVSCTTRAPRVGEVDGKSYFFVSKEQFEKLIAEDGLLEYSNHFENYYGTLRSYVMERLEENNVILDIEVDGAMQVKAKYPDALLVMLVPPSLEELRRRLLGRGTESLDKIEQRLSRMEYELSQKDKYDYVLVNDDLESTVTQMIHLITQ